MDNINQIFEFFQDKALRQKNDDILLLPHTHLSQEPGKDLVIFLSRAFNHWLDIPTDKFDQISDIITMLNDYTTLVDDIQDNSTIRRGLPVAHSIYGVPYTINAGYLGVFLALEKVHALNHPDATRIFTEQMLDIHRGQGIEIYWRDSFTLPGELEHMLMGAQKTGLFGLSLRLMQLFSENKNDFTNLTVILGLYFFVNDDYCNLRIKNVTDCKGLFEDLSEGKFSFVLNHAIRNEKRDQKVRQMLKNRPREIEIKKYCISVLEKMGSLEYTRDVLGLLDTLAWEEVARLGPNPYLEKLLNNMFFWKTECNGVDQTHV